MAVQSVPIANRASWLRMRQEDVTASVVGALLGAHEYQTAYGLWALKTGRVAEDPDETPPMQRGRLLEPVAIELLREQRPKWRVDRPALYFRDPEVRLGATPDALAADPERPGRGVIQVKTVEPSVFRRKWRGEDTGEVQPPLWIVLQALTEAHLTGATWAAVVAMTVGFGLDLHVIDVPLHQGAIKRIRASVREFWAMVESGREPDPDWRRDAKLAAQLMPAPVGSIDLGADNLLPVVLAERAERKARIKVDEARVAEIDADIRAKVGAAAGAHLPGWRISLKRVETPAYQVKARITRPLRITATGESL